MGKILITILIVLPIFAAGLYIGLAIRPKSSGDHRFSRLLLLVDRVNSRGLALCRALSGWITGLPIRNAAGRITSLCSSSWAGFSTLVGRLRPQRLVGYFSLRDLTSLRGLGAFVRRLKLSIPKIRLPFSRSAGPDRAAEPSVETDPSALNCRIRLTEQNKNSPNSDAFTVEIRRAIHARGDDDGASLKVMIVDATDGLAHASPVQAKARQWQLQDSPAFCYNCDLGKLHGQAAILSDWVAVAKVNIGWLVFPRKGKRDLRFRTSILSCQSAEELACAECTLEYENPEPGYIDMEENDRRTRTLAVALAFTVSAADGRMFKSEVDFIKDWARDNVCLSQASDKARRELEKALNKTVAFFSQGNQLNTHEICREITQIAPIAQRYDILDLCLHVARAKGSVTPEEIIVLRDLAGWLNVDKDEFRNMTERTLPVGMHQAADKEAVLGVTTEMSKDKTRQHLNKEYSKWNARVTNSDPQIQAQADQMLNLIAEARLQYVDRSAR